MLFDIPRDARRPLSYVGCQLRVATSIARLFCTSLVIVLAIGGYAGADLTASDSEFFEASVRPLLVKHCLECHGDEVQENGLRLDHRDAAMKGGSDGPVILPGDLDGSRLITAIRRTDLDLAMPPDEPLPAEAVAVLEKWINLGAPWPAGDDASPLPPDPVSRMAKIRNTHWAFQSIRGVASAAVENDGWSRNEIDRFVQARLAETGLTPSPPADRRTLVRRAYFDLIGLPPTYQQVLDFVNDPAPDAYEQLVDRLLEMPQYGERWARHWLDVARYSDTKGYIGVNKREERYPFAYTYRDYVVRALNEDVPYDQFITHQLAADQLKPGPSDRWTLAALGFLTVGPRHFNRDYRIFEDRIDVTTRGFLGMTMMCARCHDHKFDPLSMEDYYGLYGVFDSSVEPQYQDQPLLAEPPVDSQRYDRFAERLKKTLDVYRDHQRAFRDNVSDHLNENVASYLAMVAFFMPDQDGAEQKKEKPAHPRLRGGWNKDSVVLKRWRSYLNRHAAESKTFGMWNRLAKLPADEFSEKASAIIAADKSSNSLVREALRQAAPKSMTDVAVAYGNLLKDVDARWRQLQEIDPGDVAFENAEREELRQVLFGDDSPTMNLPDEVAAKLFDANESKKLKERYVDYEQELVRSVEIAPPRAMAIIDRPKPRNSPIQLRGEPSRRGKKVPRRFLNVLSHVDGGQPFRQGSGRLELARAIVHPNNPLTARVMANRIWGWHFGRGLVDTPSDFGTRGHLPTHPRLLDFLARTFIDHDWSIKAMHRLIMTSATYRQASNDRSDCRAIDAENTLLWKMNRRRLEFETMRDALLVVSRGLDSKIGGPPFLDMETPRRSLYRLIDRQYMSRLMMTFDVADPDATLPKRSTTTVPQQALYLLNSGFVNRRGREMIEQLDEETKPDAVESRIERLYQQVLGRDPDSEEKSLATRFLLVAASDPPEVARPGGEAASWQYGTGRYDEKTKTVGGFTPLRFFDGRYLQRKAESFQRGGAYFTAAGGRPGRNRQYALVRRWTATEAGMYVIKGTLELIQNIGDGDGIQALVVSDRQGQLGTYRVRLGKTRVRIVRIPIEAGERIDFVVDGRGSNRNDDFRWPVEVWRARESDNGDGGLIGIRGWKAVVGFEDAVPSWLKPMGPWEQYVQALLISNEMMFVD